MLYQIHRYPADLIDVLRLPDGQRVVIRPMLPQDAPPPPRHAAACSARRGRKNDWPSRPIAALIVRIVLTSHLAWNKARRL